MRALLSALLGLLRRAPTAPPPAPVVSPAPAPTAPVAPPQAPAGGPYAAFEAGFTFFMGPQFDGHEKDNAPGETFDTRWGVVRSTFNQWAKKAGVTNDFDHCTKDDCKAIYRAGFYDANGCPGLPPAVAMVVFVDACLMGGAVPSRNLQSILGVSVDGKLGPQTDAAAAKRDPAALERQLVQADLAHLKTLSNWPQFANGWTNREEQLMAAALKLV